MSDTAAPTVSEGASVDERVPDFSEVEAELRRLPFWRRPRKLRRQLSRTLVGVALLSVLLVAGLNIVAALNLLNDGTENQLTGIGQNRALSIERGVDRSLALTSATATDLGVATALTEFADAFERTPALDDDELDELRDWYETMVIPALAEADITATVDDVLPSTDAGRYLQYQYTAVPDLARRDDVDDAGDGSLYSDVHARLHPFLRDLAEDIRADDLLLIDAASGNVVYSDKKRIDFGTNVADGPYGDSTLATTVTERLRRARVGDALLADFEIYIPGGGRPVAFFIAAIRADTELVGALAVEFTVEALDQITTAGGAWEELGLGSGESYVVGSDYLLRSTPRGWLEDPEGYLDRVDGETAEAIERFDTPVLAQSVRTEAVEAALDGDEFAGTTTNAVGTDTFAFAAPIEVPGVEWVMVAEVPLRDARQPLFDYATRMLIVLVLVLPIAAILGWWLARRSTRPVKPVVDAATAVAGGERDPDLPDLGRDEISDLGRRLRVFAAELAKQEAELDREFEETRGLLLSVLPPRLVGATGELADDGTAVDHATAIGLAVTVPSDHDADDRLADLLAGVGAIADRLADEHGLERVRAAADRSLFLAGMRRDASGASEALSFARDLVEEVSRTSAREGLEVTVQIALSTGPVATGVLHSGAMTFSAWGDPVRRALAIVSLARPGEILVDESTRVEAGTSGFEFEAAAEVIGIDGQPMGLVRLAP